MAPSVNSESTRSSVVSGLPVAASAGHQRESTELHTRILRCMLAVDDCYSYWRHVDLGIPLGARTRVAFESRWFGVKSEARIRTIMTDMVERFDAYPEAISLLHELANVPSQLRSLICHFHTQLADPIYRRFTGDFLPKCRANGLTSIDRTQVADWIDSIEPERWAASTRLKFGSNLLATAADASLVGGNKDPRKLSRPIVPDVLVGYVLYLLRDTEIQGSLEHNSYLLSLGVDPETFQRLGQSIPGVLVNENAGVIEVSWLEPSLSDWGRRYLVGGR